MLIARPHLFVGELILMKPSKYALSAGLQPAGETRGREHVDDPVRLVAGTEVDVEATARFRVADREAGLLPNLAYDALLQRLARL